MNVVFLFYAITVIQKIKETDLFARCVEVDKQVPDDPENRVVGRRSTSDDKRWPPLCRTTITSIAPYPLSHPKFPLLPIV